ncbi:GBS Bsp-like repeat-containing protein [Paenibacillus phytohabitans]|uniref:GBS Bsp-like repeat-containing protein n=1 Tax=Paenibacillus phytohabitans TaxID=2654978 RepID=UPI0031B60DAD
MFIQHIVFFVVAPEISYAIQYNYSNSDGRLNSVVNDNGSIIIYSYDKNGNLISKNLIKKPAVQAPTEANLLDGSYVVYAYGIKKDALNVTFPTWTDYNASDDLAYPWVAGEKVSDGIWKAVVPFNKHNNETGLYYNDVWVDGVYFGGSHTLVKRNNVQIPVKVNFKDGSYEVIVEGIRDDVSKVTFYTWTEASGQDDLKQSNGQKISAGVWKVSIPLSEHNYETGIYTTHIYTTDLHGNSTGIGVQTEVIKSVQAPAEAKSPR